ncbi:MAG: hypothetical protein EOM03_02205 [Clostridia bacterium]|nr:hypothetical protein [Clostridia bacterium]
MKIHKGQALFERERFQDLRQLVQKTAEKHGDHPAYVFRRAPNAQDETRSYARFWSDIQDLGEYLLSEFEAEERAHVAHICQNSYEWMITHLPVMTAGTVAVPLDNALPEGEVLNLLERGDCEAFFANAKHFETGVKGLAELPKLRILIVNDLTLAPKEAPPALPAAPAGKVAIYLSQALAKGHALREAGSRKYLETEQNTMGMGAIFFTSGTTAAAKGVMLSQNNLLANVHMIDQIMEVSSKDRFLSVLPMHHTFEHTAGQLYPLSKGATLYFTDGLRYLGENLRDWKISCLVGVPLLFESIWRVLSRGIEASGKANMVKLARPICRNLEAAGIKVRRKVFAQILDKLGGSIRLMVVGAAAADVEVIKGFNDLGIEFYQGYGMTEHSPVITAGNRKVDTEGSTGSPAPGVEVAIAEDPELEPGQGEILARSESLMLGYYKNEAATREAIDADGWLHTGDMGYFDHRGCLHITGRYKSVIVLANGKKAFPEEIESLFNNTAGLSGTMIWGETNVRDTVDVCVRFEVDSTKLPETIGKDDEAISGYLETELQRVNKLLPDYKKIKYFVFSEERMVRNTTLKLKRNEEQDRIHLVLVTEAKTIRDVSGKRIF